MRSCNSINAQMSGVGQVDNGQNGADACDLTSAGLTISNAKFHIPTGSGGSMNINGRLVINQGSDNQNLQQVAQTDGLGMRSSSQQGRLSGNDQLTAPLSPPLRSAHPAAPLLPSEPAHQSLQ